MTQLVTIAADCVPAMVTAAGDRAAYRFLKFVTVQIRNPNTRRAYVRAVGGFLTWLEAQDIQSITNTSSLHVATLLLPAQRLDDRRDRTNCDLAIATVDKSA